MGGERVGARGAGAGAARWGAGGGRRPGAWWRLADAVLAGHYALFFLLGLGLPLAATGALRGRRRLAATFWSVTALTLGWQAVGNVLRCPPAALETWLRRREDPTWRRDITLARLFACQALGMDVPDRAFTVLAGVGGALAAYGLLRHHLPPRRRSCRLAPCGSRDAPTTAA